MLNLTNIMFIIVHSDMLDLANIMFIIVHSDMLHLTNIMFIIVHSDMLDLTNIMFIMVNSDMLDLTNIMFIIVHKNMLDVIDSVRFSNISLKFTHLRTTRLSLRIFAYNGRFACFALEGYRARGLLSPKGCLYVYLDTDLCI